MKHFQIQSANLSAEYKHTFYALAIRFLASLPIATMQSDKPQIYVSPRRVLLQPIKIKHKIGIQ